MESRKDSHPCEWRLADSPCHSQGGTSLLVDNCRVLQGLQTSVSIKIIRGGRQGSRFPGVTLSGITDFKGLHWLGS